MTKVLSTFCLLLLAAAARAAETSDRAAERTDAAIYQRIEQLRRAAAHLQCDGSDRDWKDFPEMSDPKGDADGDPHRDLVGAAVAPTDTDLWVMLRTAATPSTDRWVYCVRVDLLGDRGPRIRIELESLQHKPALRLADATGELGKPVFLAHAQVAIRRVVEMKLSFHEIAAALPAELRASVSGKLARPWVRVECETWDAAKQQFVDRGPSVASFRLIPTPYPLDAPLPERPSPPVKIGLPVRGQWLVLQGAFGGFSHQDIWAYDLVKVDATGHSASPAEGKQNVEHYGWGQPVFTPVDGRVMRARSDVEDSPPHEKPGPNADCNEVYITTNRGFGLNLVHLQKGSVNVRADDRVTAGQQVGKVGNSGRSASPHLHVAAWTGRFFGTTGPVAFTDVRVGLNPVADDPWARRLSSWEPRQGYYVGIRD